ncbi:MAG: hypothetical protein EHJ95_03935, partial [Methanobacteriota archaeon]
AYALWRWRWQGGDLRRDPAPFPSFAAVASAGIGLGVVSFLVRIVVPIGYSWDLFNLQFPFFPQYIAYFVVGLYAARSGWLSSISPATGKRCAFAAAVLVGSLPVLLVATGAAYALILGGLFWQASAYALSEPPPGAMIVVGMLWLFSSRLQWQGPATAAAAAESYAVYIVHAPVLILVSLALRNLVLPALLKFVLVLVLAILLSFAFARGIRSLPGLRSIL